MKIRFVELLAAASLFAATAVASEASAQTRTVCVDLGFLDQRVRCPGAPGVNTAGARSNCNNGGVSTQIGMEFEMWDMDTADADDFIGTWRVTGPGVNCGTFNWADAGDPPDVYVNFYPRGRGEGNGSFIRAMQNVGTAASQNWQPYGGHTTRNWGRADNCAAGATCTILPGSTIIPSSDPNAEDNTVAAALESALRTLKVFNSSINGTQTIDLRIDQLAQWPVGQQCGTACAASRTEVRVPFENGRALDGDRLSHEIGHVVHMREFGRDSLSYSCGAGWSINTTTNDGCSTGEGFASYIAMATWWDPANTTAQPSYAGFNMEAAGQIDAASCAGNRTIPGQVTKGFWDIDDANNEAAAGNSADNDSVNFTTSSILNAWDNFPAGTANRQDWETSGPNVWDYAWNAWSDQVNWSSVPFANYATLVYHNCTNNQTL